MQWLKTCLSLFLSFAILLVGSAAAASSVHKRCLMPSEQISMQMEMSSNQGMMHTDCMKTEVKIKKMYMIHHVCLSKIVLCLLPRLLMPTLLKIFRTQLCSLQ